MVERWTSIMLCCLAGAQCKPRKPRKPRPYVPADRQCGMYWLPRDKERRASKVLDPIGQLLLVHIPKAGGVSFYEGVSRYLGRCGVAKQCENYAEDLLREAPISYKRFVILRSPRDLVLSQYAMCLKLTSELRTTLPRPPTGADIYPGFDRWLRSFVDSKPKGTNRFGPALSFGCYHPQNMQARYLALSTDEVTSHLRTKVFYRDLGTQTVWLGGARIDTFLEYEVRHNAHFIWRPEDLEPSLAAATDALSRFDAVGITEFMHVLCRVAV